MSNTAPVEFANHEQNTAEINCLYVPLTEGALLVPMSAVAEVIQMPEVSAQQQAPQWFNGWLTWRQKRVPLVCFEALENEALDKEVFDPDQGMSEHSSVLVMNTLSPEKGLSYYAISVQGFAQFVRIIEDVPLEPVDAQVDVPYALMQVELDGQVMQIPDLERLENDLADSLQGYIKSLS